MSRSLELDHSVDKGDSIEVLCYNECVFCKKICILIYVYLEIKFASRGNARAFVLVDTKVVKHLPPPNACIDMPDSAIKVIRQYEWYSGKARMSMEWRTRGKARLSTYTTFVDLFVRPQLPTPATITERIINRDVTTVGAQGGRRWARARAASSGGM
jgi:hypothetical protein